MLDITGYSTLIFFDISNIDISEIYYLFIYENRIGEEESRLKEIDSNGSILCESGNIYGNILTFCFVLNVNITKSISTYSAKYILDIVINKAYIQAIGITY